MHLSFLKFKSGHFLAIIGLVLSLASTAHAVPVTLDANGTSFDAELLTGTSNVGVIFYHGRTQTPTGPVVNQLQNNLNGLGYTTLSLSDPIPLGGDTSYPAYDSQEAYINAEVFARLDAALIEMANNGVEHVVLSGFSLGSRFMTAAAAAWQTGIYAPSVNIDLLGLVGVGMYGSYSLSAPTASNPTGLADFNVLDTHSNLAFIDSIPVLDLFGSNDIESVANAGIRSAAYAGDPGQYVQTQVDCPPNDGTYYVRLAATGGGYKYEPYYLNGNDNRCHQLRNGWQSDGNGGYVQTFIVSGYNTAALETNVDNFFAQYIEPQVSVPEPGSLLLLSLGLPLLLSVRRRHRV
jgi:hypothetical protein